DVSTRPAGTASSTTKARSMSLAGNRLTGTLASGRRGVCSSRRTRSTSSHPTRPSSPWPATTSGPTSPTKPSTSPSPPTSRPGRGGGARGAPRPPRPPPGGGGGADNPPPHVQGRIRAGTRTGHGQGRPFGLVGQGLARRRWAEHVADLEQGYVRVLPRGIEGD